MAVGGELKEILKDGDKVFYIKLGGSEIKLNGEMYIILDRDSIIAKIE